MMSRRQNPARKESVQSSAFRHTTRCCACFSDYVHTAMIQGYLYSGVCTFGALQPTANFRILKGYLFSEGYLFTGFYGSAQNSAIFARHEIVLKNRKSAFF